MHAIFASFGPDHTRSMNFSLTAWPCYRLKSLACKGLGKPPRPALGAERRVGWTAIQSAGTSLRSTMFSAKAHTSEEKMDQTRAREMAKDAAEQAGKTATDTTKRVGEQVQPAFDQGKAVVQDLANQASEVGRQAVDRAGEFVEGVAPQARQAASNLYEQGARSGAYVREYAAQEPVVAMLIAGVIGFALGYLLRGATNQSDRAG
jgi:ElaB/YqjD/DUF883 family membrane-anchored ribosome-binding protein